MITGDGWTVSDHRPWTITSSAGSQRNMSPRLSRGVIHVIQEGDTLTSIARRYDVPMLLIAASNGIRDVNLIHVGQRLEVKR
jgi:LysM domain